MTERCRIYSPAVLSKRPRVKERERGEWVGMILINDGWIKVSAQPTSKRCGTNPPAVLVVRLERARE